MTEENIVKFLLDLGINPSHKGFRAIVYAVVIVMKDPNALDHVTKEIYPGVGKRMGETWQQAEIRIRYAIESLFDNQACEDIEKKLGFRTSMHKGKCTNSEFLALCYWKLKGTVE